MTRRPDLLLLTLLAALLFAPACSREAKTNPGIQGQKSPPAVRITAVAVEARDVQRTVELTGTLRPEDELTISSPGESVKERTPLLVLVRTAILKLSGEILERFAPRCALGSPSS